MTNLTRSPEELRAEIEQEIADNKILIYTKGTKEMPRCGFTQQICQLFNHFGHPFETIDILEDLEKKEMLIEMTNWPTTPKVYLGGKFYGGTDIMVEMAQKGELQPILEGLFQDA